MMDHLSDGNGAPVGGLSRSAFLYFYPSRLPSQLVNLVHPEYLPQATGSFDLTSATKPQQSPTSNALFV